MTNNGDPSENAVAERINGILKQKFVIYTDHADLDVMRKIIKEAVDIYNNKRPHYSNHMLTPIQMHNQCDVQMKTYKRKNSNKNEPVTV